MQHLINTLPEQLKSKIMIYYLSYGTPSANIFRFIIKNSVLMKMYKLTCWQLFVIRSGTVRCRRRLSINSHAYYELLYIYKYLLSEYIKCNCT